MVCRQTIRARLGPSRVLATEGILEVGAALKVSSQRAHGVRRFTLSTLLLKELTG